LNVQKSSAASRGRLIQRPFKSVTGFKGKGFPWKEKREITEGGKDYINGRAKEGRKEKEERGYLRGRKGNEKKGRRKTCYS